MRELSATDRVGRTTKQVISPEQQAAQQQLLEVLGLGFGADLGGINIYRDDGLLRLFEAPTSDDIEQSLKLLDVPCSRRQVAVMAKGVGPAFELTVKWDDIGKLRKWFPQLSNDGNA